MTATPSPTLLSLAGRVEQLTGRCRETDLAIHLALYPDGKIAQLTANHRRGFDGETGTAWDLYSGAICYETRNEQGHCYSNGGHPLPAVTGSLDAAMTLVPEGFVWTVSKLGNGKFWASIAHPDGEGGYPVEKPTAAPAGALTSACLRARSALEASHG